MIKLFEDFNNKKVVDDIKDLLLNINDEYLYTKVEYNIFREYGLSKKKNGWKSIPGTYVGVYISVDKEQKDPFILNETVYETILDVNNYMKVKFGVIEDGYNIEYYYQTYPKEIEEVVGIRTGGYFIRKKRMDPKEDSFYYLDELYEYGGDEKFVYIHISYKLD